MKAVVNIPQYKDLKKKWNKPVEQSFQKLIVAQPLKKVFSFTSPEILFQISHDPAKEAYSQPA
jgi:hypothetical protein